MTVFVIALLALLPQEKVPEAVRKSLDDFLRAAPADEKPALTLALKALKGNLALAAEAVRSHPPLTAGTPGTQHGLKFSSGGKD